MKHKKIRAQYEKMINKKLIMGCKIGIIFSLLLLFASLYFWGFYIEVSMSIIGFIGGFIGIIKSMKSHTAMVVYDDHFNLQIMASSPQRKILFRNIMSMTIINGERVTMNMEKGEKVNFSIHLINTENFTELLSIINKKCPYLQSKMCYKYTYSYTLIMVLFSIMFLVSGYGLIANYFLIGFIFLILSFLMIILFYHNVFIVTNGKLLYKSLVNSKMLSQQNIACNDTPFSIKFIEKITGDNISIHKFLLGKRSVNHILQYVK